MCEGLAGVLSRMLHSPKLLSEWCGGISSVFRKSTLAHSVFTLAVSALVIGSILGFAFGQFNLVGFNAITTALFPVQPWWAVTALLLLLFALLHLAKGETLKGFRISNTILVVALIVVLCTDISARRFSFYPGNDARLFILLLGIPLVVLHLMRFRYEHVGDGIQRFFSLPLVIFFQILIAVLFIELADGRVLFSDDHPSFWYRLYLLKEQFPQIPFYSPAWEAGYSAREFFASGILNVFFLTYPLWYLDTWFLGTGLLNLDLTNLKDALVYNYIIIYVFIFLLPLSVYLAAKLFGHSKNVAAIAALLALGPTLGQFEWLLKYGTLGFCCSVGFLPLALSLVYRLAFAPQKPKLVHMLSLLVISFLVVSWSLSVFTFLPVALLGMVFYRETFATKRRSLVIGFAVLFLLVNLPWVKVFVEESKVFSFVNKTALPGAMQDSEDIRKSLKHSISGSLSIDKSRIGEAKEILRSARQLLAKVNPLLVVLLLPGILLLQDKRKRQLFSTTIAFLLFLAFFGELLKPQLELRRMIIPASYLACIPAAVALLALISNVSSALLEPHRVLKFYEKVSCQVALVIISGMLLFSPITVAAVFQNRSDEQFRFAPTYLEEMANSIKTHGGSGRVLFLGFVLHEFGAADYRSQDGGHVAILAALSGKPMYAHYYYHSRWQTIDPIPRAFRDRGETGIEEFLDLLNVTAVITSKSEWAKYCRKRERYSEVEQFDRFRIFTRQGPASGYLLKGEAEVSQSIDGIEVVPYTREVKLKFRYLPKLRTDKPEMAELFAFPGFVEDTGKTTSEKVEFLGLKVSEEQLGKPLRISY